MWKTRPKETRRCKRPGLLRILLAPPGSVWECPRCGSGWIVKTEERNYANHEAPDWTLKHLEPADPPSL